MREGEGSSQEEQRSVEGRADLVAEAPMWKEFGAQDDVKCGLLSGTVSKGRTGWRQEHRDARARLHQD